jgi:hypothetical protein
MRKLRYAFFLALLCVTGCRTASTQSIRIDPALVMLTPADTTLLAGVRMDVLRPTPLFQRWVKLGPLDEFAKNTGVDPRKDLWEILIAYNGSSAAVMARGKFAETGIEPKLNIQGARRIPYKGFTLIGNEQAAVVFINPSTAVMGKVPMLKTIIDQRNSPKPGGAAAVLAMARQIPAQNQMWMVARDVRIPVMQEPGMAGNMAKMLSMLQTVTAAGDLRTGVTFYADGTCRTEQDAKSLGDAVRGMIGLGRLSTPDDKKELLRVYDAIKVDQTQRTVRVAGDVPQSLVDELLARWGTLSPAQPGRPRGRSRGK